jgi:WD40 repeat protein
MMNEYKPITIKKFAQKINKNNEVRKYKKFKETKSEDTNLNCNHVKICESDSNYIAFFVFDNIHYYDLNTDKIITRYPQSTEQITTGNLRKDARLIYSGTSNGKVNIYESHKKICIKSFNAHKLQVNSIDIAENFTNFVTSSNDLVKKTIIKIF